MFICVAICAGCEAPIKGIGNLQTEQRKLQSFNGVLTDLTGSMELVASANGNNEITIEAQKNILPYIKTDIVKNELIITMQQGVRILSYANVKIKLHCKTLESVKLLGACDIKIADSAVVPHNMLCSIMGSGNMYLSNGVYSNLRLQNSGSGNMEALNCIAQNGDYGLKGAGNIFAKSTKVQSLKAILSGSGFIKAWATDSLLAETTDAGVIEYAGTPSYLKVKVGKVGVIKNVP